MTNKTIQTTQTTQTPQILLSKSILEKVQAHPINTILRSSSEQANVEFEIAIKNLPTKGQTKIDIPENFDGRQVWIGLLPPVMDQGSCGSCWAFASTSMLAARFNIQSIGQMNIQLSPTKLILCDWQGHENELTSPEQNPFVSAVNTKALESASCFGNTLVDACRYLYYIGTPSEECIPYTKNLGLQGEYQSIGSFTNVTDLPLCYTVSGPQGGMCSNFYFDKEIGTEGGEPAKFYKCLHFYGIAGTPKDGGDESQLRRNIYRYGPIITGIKIYPDFYTFDAKNQIYKWNGEGPLIGGHACELVGWGIENNTKYWIIKNSWGEKWGDKGYFRMLRGVNECDVEDGCLAMIPDFFYPSNYKFLDNPILKELPNLVEQRQQLKLLIDKVGGGIDPTTGYTKRAMITFPWLRIARPVELDNLPNWETFIAGIDCTPRNRAKFKAKLKAIANRKVLNEESSILFLTLVIILCLTSGYVMYKIIKNNNI